MSNIITINKNNIAIAPTYMITKDNAKNSTSKYNNRTDDNKKTLIKDKTECTGFLELITKKEANNKLPTKKNNIFFKTKNNSRKTGFEPAAFGVTGQYSNQLSYFLFCCSNLCLKVTNSELKSFKRLFLELRDCHKK